MSEQSIQGCFKSRIKYLVVFTGRKLKKVTPLIPYVSLFVSNHLLIFPDKINRTRVDTDHQHGCRFDLLWPKWVFMPKSHQLLIKPTRGATGVIPDSNQHWSHELHRRWHWYWFFYSLHFRAKLFKQQSNEFCKHSCVPERRHIQHCGLAEPKQPRDVYEWD